ncbi:MAG TPA: glycosyltransferase, partial [Chitinophagales bacterium]|nr:glycosyltransferase [Chitinophagales bacterium]
MLSIIIPTKDRTEILKLTLQKAIEAIEGFEIEIIVVNDGNEIKEKFENPKIQYFKNPKKGVTTARNYG